ncbi:hypothetical protein SDC9_113143 [bioreactor metagenome]|uniref:Uncharacterized protein n=1 Tax=bioreactor metagenome TaxID=1076179 RepID=A0A645BLP7_9ZZZZ
MALPDRADQVDDAAGHVLLGGLHPQPLLRVQRGQLGEIGTILHLLGRLAVDRVETHQRVVLLATLPLAGLTDGAGDDVTLAESVFAHHRQRDVGIVGSGQVATGPHESVVVEDIENAADLDQHIVVMHRLVDALGLVAGASITAAAALALTAVAGAARSAGLLVLAGARRCLVGRRTHLLGDRLGHLFLLVGGRAAGGLPFPQTLADLRILAEGGEPGADAVLQALLGLVASWFGDWTIDSFDHRMLASLRARDRRVLGASGQFCLRGLLGGALAAVRAALTTTAGAGGGFGGGRDRRGAG